MDNSTVYPGFLGRGWKFPPEFDRNTCGPLMSEAEQDIKESLSILLSTRMRERVMQPVFGCNLISDIFESVNVTLLTLLKEHISLSISRYEPRIDLINIVMDTRGIYEGRIIIDIQYLIRAINRRDNIVYPFYLLEGTNISDASFPPNV